VKAITLHQPWASLVAVGAKTIETRSWSTRFRGPLAIHAGLGKAAVDDPVWRACGALTVDEGIGLYPTLSESGAVVATCQLVDVLPIVAAWPGNDPCCWTEAATEPRHYGDSVVAWTRAETGALIHRSTTDAPFGDFSPGRFAWLLDDVRAIRPMPCGGRRQLWAWTTDEPIDYAVDVNVAG
jgi:hypothetical protein